MRAIRESFLHKIVGIPSFAYKYGIISNPLSLMIDSLQMSYVLFHEAGLMETFRVPQREFINYFRALEANYGSNVCKYTCKTTTCVHACTLIV